MNARRRALARRLGVFTLMSALTACVQHWQEVHELGALRLTEYWEADKLDWEGGNTSVVRTKLCVGESDHCVEATHLSIEPQSWEHETPRWIAVYATDGDRAQRFFDTQTGTQLACDGCGPAPSDPEFRSSLHWSRSGSDAAATILDAATQRLMIAWLEFDPKRVRLTAIDPRPLGPKPPPEVTISADGSRIAWITCGVTCVVRAVDLPALTSSEGDTQCPFHEYMQVAWRENVPYAQYYWGAGIGSMRDTLCRDASGAIALPIGAEP